MSIRDYQPYLEKIQHWWNVYECYKYQSPLEQVNSTMADMGFHDASLHMRYHGDNVETQVAFKDLHAHKKECEEAHSFIQHFTKEKKVNPVEHPSIVFAILIGLSLSMKTENIYTVSTMWLYHATQKGYIQEDDFIYLAPLGIKPLLAMMVNDGLLDEQELPALMQQLERQEWDEAMSTLYDHVYGYALHPLSPLSP